MSGSWWRPSAIAFCAVACGFPPPKDIVGDSNSEAGLRSPSSSCDGLSTKCGPFADDDCCASLRVPAGTYYRSYDISGTDDSGTTEFPASVSSFRLDKYEVTVGRFRAFVQAGMGTQANPPREAAGAHSSIPASGWDPAWNARLEIDMGALTAGLKCDATYQTWTDRRDLNESRPINCVKWYEAMAFCAWDGGYLPSDAEWGFASAGGEQQRAYPWSEPASSRAITPTRASYRDGTTCVGDGMQGCTASDILDVGSRPDGVSRWGHLDLAGNLSEMVLDWAGRYPVPCADCANLTISAQRATHGGSFDSNSAYLRTKYSGGATVTVRYADTGIRCARPL